MWPIVRRGSCIKSFAVVRKSAVREVGGAVDFIVFSMVVIADRLSQRITTWLKFLGNLVSL